MGTPEVAVRRISPDTVEILWPDRITSAAVVAAMNAIKSEAASAPPRFVLSTSSAGADYDVDLKDPGLALMKQFKELQVQCVAAVTNSSLLRMLAATLAAVSRLYFLKFFSTRDEALRHFESLRKQGAPLVRAQ